MNKLFKIFLELFKAEEQRREKYLLQREKEREFLWFHSWIIYFIRVFSLITSAQWISIFTCTRSPQSLANWSRDKHHDLASIGNQWKMKNEKYAARSIDPPPFIPRVRIFPIWLIRFLPRVGNCALRSSFRERNEQNVIKFRKFSNRPDR